MAKVSSNVARKRRHARIRATVSGTSAKPRLCVFRSLSNIYAQIIDDTSGVTLVSAGSSSSDIKEKAGGKNKSQVAELVGSIWQKMHRIRALAR